MLALLLVGLLLLHTGACQPDPYEELMALHDGYEESFRALDSVATASLHARKGKMLSPTGQLARGTREITRMLQEMMDSGVKGVSFHFYDIHFSANGEMGSFWCDTIFLNAHNGTLNTAKTLGTTTRERGKMRLGDVVFVSTLYTTLADEHMKDDIPRALEKEDKAWNHHDVQGILDAMTDDVVVLLPGRDAAKGKEEVRIAMEERLSALGDAQIHYGLEEQQMIDPKWGYRWGYYTVTDSSQKVVDKGKYLSVCILEDEVLKDHRLMMNSNMYPASCVEP